MMKRLIIGLIIIFSAAPTLKCMDGNLADGYYRTVEVGFDSLSNPNEHTHYMGPIESEPKFNIKKCNRSNPSVKHTVHIKKMGKIDEMILKNTIQSSEQLIRNQLERPEKKEPYIVQSNKKNKTEYIVKVPAILVIFSTFNKQDNDELTQSIYTKLNSQKNKKQRVFKIDNCTRMREKNANSVSCVTKLYDRFSIEKILKEK